VFAALLGSGIASALAQSAPPAGPQLGDVSVTATRTENPIEEVAPTVTVIGDEEIERAGAGDIKDLIRYEPGLSVRGPQARFAAAGGTGIGRGGNEGFTIRGLEGNQVLMLIDGIRVPSAFSFGAQNVGRGDFLDLEAFRRVEILRGPASTLYGSDGLAGVVSFVTRDPKDYLDRLGKDIYVGLRTAYQGADRSFAHTLATAARCGRWEGLVSYTRRDGHEPRNLGSDPSLNANRTTPNPQDIRSGQWLGKAVLALDARNRFRLTGESLDRRVDTDALSARTAPPLGAASVLDLKARDTITRDRVSLDHSYTDPSGRWYQRASWMAYWQDATVRQLAFEDRNTAADRVRDNRYRVAIYGVSGQAESSFAAIGAAHRLIYGIDANRSRYTGLRDGTVPPAGETFPTKPFPDTDYTLLGAFVQDELAFADARLLLTLGVRFDYYKLEPETSPLYVGAVAGSSDHAISPRLGAVWRLVPETNAANLFAQYARGFRAPTPDQVNNGFVNTVANYRSIANPDLKPESSDTFEAGMRGAGTAGRYSVSAFYGRYRDFIFQRQVAGNFTIANPAVFQFVNLGEVAIRGAEARAEYRVTRAWTALAGLAYARGDQDLNGTETPLDTIDPLKGVLGVRYAAERWGGALNWTLVRAKESARVSNPAFFKSPGFGVLDLSAYWVVNRHLAFTAGLFNAFNKKYYLWADVRGSNDSERFKEAFTQPGRSLSASARVQF
jgi:hemoglobin/transferrin/lactoferrin receptor protein